MAEPVLILHGPNLNLLGTREPEIYGSLALGEIDKRLGSYGQTIGLEVRTRQSNLEGELVEALQESCGWARGVVFNPAGYTHTSVALRDAVAAIGLPVIETHLSNIASREDFRRRSLIAPVCAGTISGLGWRSYLLALQALAYLIEAK